MSQFQVETTQNVQLSYKIAPLSRRISAKIIDGVIIVFYYIFMATVLAASIDRITADDLGNIWVYIGLIGLPVLLYPLLCEWIFNGQTFGKMARDIRVIKDDGSPATVGSFLLRWLIGLIEIQLGGGAIAIVAILFNNKAQRLGDLAAGTVVIWEQETVDLSETIYRKLDDAYEPVYLAAAQLADQDVALIQEVLARYEIEDWERGTELIRKISQKMELKLGIEKQSDDFTFLKVLMKDFNHLTGKL